MSDFLEASDLLNAKHMLVDMIFTQPYIQAQMKENIKAPRYWPLCGEVTGDWWIPRTKAK